MIKNDIEFRKSGTPDSKGYIPKDRTAELVVWEFHEANKKEYCYTIAWFKKDSEGYYVKTVGSRFTDYHDPELAMKMAKYGLKVLNAEFDLED